MKNETNKMKRIQRFLATWWQQLLGIPVALAAFVAVPGLLLMLDPTAAPFDPGILHIINLAWVEMLVYNALAWVGLIASFKPLAYWFKNDLLNEFKELSAWQRTKLSFAVYFFYLFCFVLLSLAL